MANFAVQLKDKFIDLVERVTGYGRAAAGDKDSQAQPTKPPQDQPVVIRSRDPDGDGGSHDVVN
ncbi:hypothetical protein ACP70R_010405 [Stipagrostis hirtigluma subsp. patula]